MEITFNTEQLKVFNLAKEIYGKKIDENEELVKSKIKNKEIPRKLNYSEVDSKLPIPESKQAGLF